MAGYLVEMFRLAQRFKSPMSIEVLMDFDTMTSIAIGPYCARHLCMGPELLLL